MFKLGTITLPPADRNHVPNPTPKTPKGHLPHLRLVSPKRWTELARIDRIHPPRTVAPNQGYGIHRFRCLTRRHVAFGQIDVYCRNRRNLTQHNGDRLRIWPKKNEKMGIYMQLSHNGFIHVYTTLYLVLVCKITTDCNKPHHSHQC
jgi:hypothetical protein